MDFMGSYMASLASYLIIKNKYEILWSSATFWF